MASAAAALLSSPLWISRVRSAATFYLVEGVLRALGAAIILASGLEISRVVLTESALAWLSGGMVLGLVSVPMMIDRRRRWVRASMERGYLARSLDRESGTWDVANDFDHLHKDPRVMRPPFLWRVAFWIGPAIGMSLSDVVGQPTADVIMALLITLAGYGILLWGVMPDAAWWLEIRRVERELGRRVMLKAEPTHGAHGGR